MLLALGTVDDKEKEGLSAGRRQYGCTFLFSLNSVMEYVPKTSVLSTDGTLYLPAGHQQGPSAPPCHHSLLSPVLHEPCDRRPVLGNCLVPLVFLVLTCVIQRLAFVPELSTVLSSPEWGTHWR